MVRAFITGFIVVLSAAVLGGICPNPARAGAWVPKPGEGYLKLSTKWLLGMGYHDETGDTRDYGTYHEVFVSNYGEVGLVEALALVWHADLMRFFSLEDPTIEESEEHVTFGDPELGVRWAFWRPGRLVMSLQAAVRVPLARDDPVQPFFYEDGTVAGALRVGAGVWDLTTGYHVGYGFDGWYLQGSTGYILRTTGYDDVVFATAEAGTHFTDIWSGRLRLVGHFAIEQSDAPYSENPSGIGNGVSYTGFALETEVELQPNWWLGVSFEGGIARVIRQTGGPVFNLYGAHRF